MRSGDFPRTRHVRDATEFRTQSTRLPIEVLGPILANVGEMTKLTFAPLLPDP
jgi:hypothetical protein